MVDDLVVLVDAAGTPIGEERKSQVHTAFTPLHLAFSVYLFDGDGNVLMTRRALSKLTWPGVWTNSCCGHQKLGEEPIRGVGRRTHTELGLSITDLRCVLPDWRPVGFFGERLYALRPYAPQVPRAVQCLVDHLRQALAAG